MYEFRFRLKGEFAEPHWLTTVKRWDDGSLKEVNNSFVTTHPWSRRRRFIALTWRRDLDDYYRKQGKPNNYELVELIEGEWVLVSCAWAPELAAGAKAKTHPRELRIEKDKAARDWRHECGYKLLEVCRNCVHCLVQESGLRTCWRYYCMRTWRGESHDAFHGGVPKETRQDAWEHMEGHDVEPLASCRHVRIKR